ncbi:MAG: hypothetical protein ACXVQX_07060 [Actinomycetota bacterium]
MREDSSTRARIASAEAASARQSISRSSSSSACVPRVMPAT